MHTPPHGAYNAIQYNAHDGSLLQEELPEALLGTVRLDHLDLSKAALLDIDTGVISNQS